MPTTDKATLEQLWKDPDWKCPCCGWINRAIRERCRNFYCGWDTALVSEGCMILPDATHRDSVPRSVEPADVGEALPSGASGLGEGGKEK